MRHWNFPKPMIKEQNLSKVKTIATNFLSFVIAWSKVAGWLSPSFHPFRASYSITFLSSHQISVMSKPE